ncbi:hypothetical protein RRG08_060334 [Elysia crispata]|uniref:Uncharacterized protein n=1 Tax=Elysia crispata TaxID=231223 RepID=A0AAE0ZHK1_9GAST|nr:hypothetical protein RRG08_060334 [Elysia crispata]
MGENLSSRTEGDTSICWSVDCPPGAMCGSKNKPRAPNVVGQRRATLTPPGPSDVFTCSKKPVSFLGSVPGGSKPDLHTDQGAKPGPRFSPAQSSGRDKKVTSAA